jgi:predicted  nucleic acid-binding Zn-ribbon protein
MTTTANSLREIHSLHQRSKAIRDRLLSVPKTIVARQAQVARKQDTLDKAKKDIQQIKVSKGLKEVQRKSLLGKIDDYSSKLLTVKKNEEYKAIQNEIALVKSQVNKVDDEIIDYEIDLEDRDASVKLLEADLKKAQDDLATYQKQSSEAKTGEEAKLEELAHSLLNAEAVINPDIREQYQRVIRQRGAEAMAVVESGACMGCNMSITSQMLNDLINCDTLVFCRSCGRILYMAEEVEKMTKRIV